MIHPFLEDLGRWNLERFAAVLEARLTDRLREIAANDRKGQLYGDLMARLPAVRPGDVDLDRDWIRIGRPADLPHAAQQGIGAALRRLIPWRKGPYEIFGIRVDCEWASYLKWRRLTPGLASLAGRRVLDIGSSSGYYMFRMLPAAPALVLGIEPYLTYYFQFRLLQHYIAAPNVFTLPLRLEAFPVLDEYFDTVFCMGILYHQREPRAALARIGQLLRPGGELVLETLVLAGGQDDVLIPPGRYAKMNNVYAIPTVGRIEKWLRQAGFSRMRCVDTTPTTPAEQRRTDWMPFESLADFLDPGNPGATLEGHPAPLRAVMLAERR
jgi:tRNA (mo5U34)-methyltransferase